MDEIKNPYQMDLTKANKTKLYNQGAFWAFNTAKYRALLSNVPTFTTSERQQVLVSVRSRTVFARRIQTVRDQAVVLLRRRVHGKRRGIFWHNTDDLREYRKARMRRRLRFRRLCAARDNRALAPDTRRKRVRHRIAQIKHTPKSPAYRLSSSYPPSGL